MDKTNKVMILSSIVLVGFVVAVIYHYILGFYLKLNAPYDTFLFPAFCSFCDFNGAFPFIKDFAPYQEVTNWIVYFPLAYFIILPFAFIKNVIISYLLFISGFLAFLLSMNIKNFTCRDLNKLQNFQNIFILTVISYPVLYILDKGNFDMFLFVILALFTYAFKAEKYFLSAILLAIENAIKPFTILFLFLFLFKKKYKEFFLSAILSGLLIIGGFMIFKGNFFDQVIILIKSLASFNYTYVFANENPFGMGHASSLFMLLKLIFCKITATPIISTIVLSKFYNYLCLIITAITLFFVWKEKMFWKQITLLVCHFLLLPSITYDYKLLFLFIPIWLFINEPSKSKFDLTYTVLFSLLLIPKNIIIKQPALSPTIATWFSLSIIINPIIILLLMVLIIYEQIYMKKQPQVEQNKESL